MICSLSFKPLVHKAVETERKYKVSRCTYLLRHQKWTCKWEIYKLLMDYILQGYIGDLSWTYTTPEKMLMVYRP